MPHTLAIGSVTRKAFAIAMAASLMAAAAQAQPIIFDNVPVGFPLGSGGAVIRGMDADPPLASISLAQPFTPAEDAPLGFVQLGLNSPRPSALIDVALYSGSGSGPDTLIESFGTVDESQMPSAATDFDTGAVILTSTLKPLLQAGTEYYIVAIPATSTSEAAWADVPQTTGFWSDIGGGGWQYQGGVWGWQKATRVFAAPATTLVGPPDLPYGINNLAIVHSGGIALFDVRFDERSFNEAYGATAPTPTFTTGGDVESALRTVGGFLGESLITRVSSTPTYSGTFNDNLVSPLTFDDADVLMWAEIAHAGPAGWHYGGVWNPTLSRSQSLEEFDPQFVWAFFTPVPTDRAVLVKTITVTHPGNASDDPHGGYGSVDYVYDIGQFEITTGQYTEFLNAVAGDDTYGLYNPDMWDADTGCRIERTGAPTIYTYSVATDWRDLPVNFVSWGDAARFCNWLHNGQPTGAQDLTTTENGSYFLNGAMTDEELLAITREPDATWVLPSEDEWYKAAYHNNDGATANYWDYPTGSDTAPWSEAPPGTNMDDGSANYYDSDFAVGHPYYRTDVGAYDAKPSTSPYGTFDQGGNVSEWNEGIVFDSSRGMRGGAFYSSSNDIRSWSRAGFYPTLEFDGFGFRVVRLRNDVEPCSAIPERLGGFHASGYTKNVAVGGDIAYLARGAYGLSLVDVSDPAAPVHLSSPDMSTNAFDACVEGSTVYVTDWNAGLLIVDASTPTSPALLGSYDVGGPAYGLTVQGTTAYVAAFGHGLQIIDVSAPTTPTYLGGYAGGGFAFDVAVVGNIAYVASFDAGLQIIDVSDPANTTLLGEFDTPGFAVSVAVEDGVAYIADGESGLHVIDVSDPTTPWPLGSYDTPDMAINVVVEGDIAYVADGNAGLQLIDVSAPASPALLGWYGTPGTAGGLLVAGYTVYVADGDFGLHIVDVGRPSVSVTPQGSLDAPSHDEDVTVVGAIAYVPDFFGVRIVDVGDPAAPVSLGSHGVPDGAAAVAVADSTVYVAAKTSGLLVVDVSDPAAPALLGTYDTPGQAVDLKVAGAIAYVADVHSLQIVDVSDPTAPALLGALDAEESIVNAVDLVGTTAYLATSIPGPSPRAGAGLDVVDVSDPTSPVSIGFHGTSGANDVAVVGTIAYVADNLSGVQIIDVADPNSPVWLGSYDELWRAWGVTASRTTVYVAAGESGLHVVDASNPAAPFQLGSYDTSGFGEATAVLGTTVYLADGGAGLQSFDVANPCGVFCEADLDDNDQSDLLDCVIFGDFMLGPDHSLSNGGGTADLDADGDADLRDFALFQAAFGCRQTGRGT